MSSLSWLVTGSILSLFSPAYAEAVHIPLIRHVLPYPDSTVARSFLGVERRTRVDASLSGTDTYPGDIDLIPINFGTPTQTLTLMLDFTFAGPIVAGCKGCNGGSGGPTVFNYTKSSSARNKSASTQTISPVGESSIGGSVFTDVIGFGPFSVLNASFFVFDTDTESDTPLAVFPYGPGIFGLGFPSASFQNLPSLSQSLLSSNAVDAPEMGIWLSRAHDTSTLKALTPGVFTFGGTNSSLYTGAIEFLDSTSTSAWMLNITTLTIQGYELTFTQSRNNVAFNARTSKPMIYGPRNSVETIWAQVPGASLLVDPLTDGSDYYQYSCSTTLNVSVSFGGRSWTIDPAEMKLGGPQAFHGSDGHCIGAIIGLDVPEDQPGWYFGSTFLRGVYTVLRQGNPPAIGFAELSEKGGGAPSSTLPSTSSSRSASSPSISTPPPASAKSPVAAVVGGVVGGVVLCAALLAALLVTRKRRRQNRPKLNSMDEDGGGVNHDLTPEPFVAVDQHPEMAPLNSAQRRFKRKHRVDGGSGSATGESPSGGENGGSSSPAAAATDVSVMEQLRNLTEEVRRLAERDPGDSTAPPSYHPDA
ncbi:aspartic peptidase domain-containing protein [Favolaschia claudopus]|uniref:Aspartic peptidase domain-containing protein n=1 Tax=Favolaschia claudopus TaxID=2862362 RepID=A0AAW0EFT1_9AGAR